MARSRRSGDREDRARREGGRAIRDVPEVRGGVCCVRSGRARDADRRGRAPWLTQLLRRSGKSCFWAYANLAMAHAAIDDKASIYSRKHYIIRSRLYAGLRRQTLKVRSLADDERAKMM